MIEATPAGCLEWAFRSAFSVSAIAGSRPLVRRLGPFCKCRPVPRGLAHLELTAAPWSALRRQAPRWRSEFPRRGNIVAVDALLVLAQRVQDGNSLFGSTVRQCDTLLLRITVAIPPLPEIAVAI